MQDNQWGMIFLVNLAPADELSPDSMWKEILLKEESFRNLVSEVSDQGPYTSLGAVWIVNKLMLPGCKPQQRMFSLICHTPHDPNSPILETLDTSHIPPGNIGDPGLLQQYFRLAVEKLKAGKYLLFTWDHGFGYGIFSRRLGTTEKFLFIDDDLSISDRFFLANRNFFYSQHQNWLNCLTSLSSDQFPDVLTNNELASAIKQGFPNGKVEVLAMMNCCMQLLDTGFAFRDSVEYLVAPQTVMWWEGYHYGAIARKLDGPDCSARDAALEVLASERLKLQEADPAGSQHSSLSVVDCYQSARVVQIFKDILDFISQRRQKYLGLLKASRASLDNLSTLDWEVIQYFGQLPLPYRRVLLKDHAPFYHYYDFYSVWQGVYERLSPTDPLAIKLSEMLDCKDQHILAISPAPNVYTSVIPGRSRQLQATGVCIFFPEKVSDITTGPGRYIRDTFYNRFPPNQRFRTQLDQQTNWSLFLRNVYMVS